MGFWLGVVLAGLFVAKTQDSGIVEAVKLISGLAAMFLGPK